jgi:head-tail adaptor
MRKASKFPNAKNSPRVQRELRLWLQFRDEVDNHKRIVFADEKPLKEIDIYGTVRRDLVDGHVPYHKMNANSRNRNNILAAVTLLHFGVAYDELVVN